MPKTDDEPSIVPLNTSVLAWQRELVEQYARENGLLGLSAALRAILTEFRNMKMKANQYQPQEQPA